MNKWLAVTGSCLALAFVGCGGDDEESSGGGGGGSEAPAETESSGGGGGGTDIKVSMKNIQFQPEGVTISKGGTVTWTNDESVGHDVTKKGGPGADFKSGDPGGMQAGDTFKHKFATAGKVDYVCTVHPSMTGSVTVK
jgi:plastocyanin